MIFIRVSFDEESELDIDDDEMEENNNNTSDNKPLSTHEQKNVEEKNNMIICYCFFTVIWSIGGVLTKNSRDKFDVFFRELCDKTSEKDKLAR